MTFYFIHQGYPLQGDVCCNISFPWYWWYIILKISITVLCFLTNWNSVTLLQGCQMDDIFASQLKPTNQNSPYRDISFFSRGTELRNQKEMWMKWTVSVIHEGCIIYLTVGFPGREANFTLSLCKNALAKQMLIKQQSGQDSTRTPVWAF